VLFNSTTFAIFLPLVFGLYWAVTPRRRNLQNVILLFASYIFYGWWDARFLALIVLSSSVDYVIGLGLPRARRPAARKLLLATSVVANLGCLGVFKYYEFFADSLVQLATSIGLTVRATELNIVLPVGISFYTFQTLSYTIDVYRRKIEPTTDALSFFTFVAFFPQLVAGPIERARNLLPQFRHQRSFDGERARDGLRQILSGLLKKVVIADNLSPHVDRIFDSYSALPSSHLVLGLLFFAIQIYCDFSGYSDIAIGTGRLFGISLSRNFAFPYFSRNIAEFWIRWHISLSSWFRDYVYIPLGGSRRSTPRTLANVFVTFLVSGLWHGANWTFVAWGALNAAAYGTVFLAHRVARRQQHATPSPPTLADLPRMATTFAFTLVAWTFFRADSIQHAAAYLATIGGAPLGMGEVSALALPSFGCASLLAFEWWQRGRSHALDIAHLPRATRWICYCLALFCVVLLGNFGHQSFIYFQF